MNEPLDRNQIIQLLTNLGKEQDEKVLLAARSLHSRVTESGLTWEDLLVKDQSEINTETKDNFLKDEDENIPEISVDETQTLSLIEKLLANDNFSSDLHEELMEYQTEISDGKFEPRDHRYVHALYTRLTKS